MIRPALNPTEASQLSDPNYEPSTITSAVETPNSRALSQASSSVSNKGRAGPLRPDDEEDLDDVELISNDSPRQQKIKAAEVSWVPSFR